MNSTHRKEKIVSATCTCFRILSQLRRAPDLVGAFRKTRNMKIARKVKENASFEERRVC